MYGSLLPSSKSVFKRHRSFTMASRKPLPTGKHTLSGSCHCKAIQFTATNVDFSMMSKCNCTLCQSKNRYEDIDLGDLSSYLPLTDFRPAFVLSDYSIGIMLGNNDIKLRQSDGAEKVINYDNVKTEAPPELATYIAGIRKDGGKVNMHFCNKCGADLFYTESIPAMPENFINVNLMALDLKSIGIDYKDVTHPEVSTYVSGLDDSWNRRKGEPFDNGSW